MVPGWIPRYIKQVDTGIPNPTRLLQQRWRLTNEGCLITLSQTNELCKSLVIVPFKRTIRFFLNFPSQFNFILVQDQVSPNLEVGRSQSRLVKVRTRDED